MSTPNKPDDYHNNTSTLNESLQSTPINDNNQSILNDSSLSISLNPCNITTLSNTIANNDYNSSIPNTPFKLSPINNNDDSILNKLSVTLSMSPDPCNDTISSNPTANNTISNISTPSSGYLHLSSGSSSPIHSIISIDNPTPERRDPITGFISFHPAKSGWIASAKQPTIDPNQVSQFIDDCMYEY